MSIVKRAKEDLVPQTDYSGFIMLLVLPNTFPAEETHLQGTLKFPVMFLHVGASGFISEQGTWETGAATFLQHNPAGGRGHLKEQDPRFL